MPRRQMKMGWASTTSRSGSGTASRSSAQREANGITGVRVRDHRVSQSIYLDDPDGNRLELYVDADPAIWRQDPSTVATSVPLQL